MKINLDHFSFETCPMRIESSILGEYEKFKKLKVKTDYQKLFIQMVKTKMKSIPMQIVGTHLKSKIKKTWNKPESDFNKESLAKEIISALSEERNKKRKVKVESKTYDGASFGLIGGVHPHGESGAILQIGKNTTANDPFKDKLPKLSKTNYIGVELEFNDGVLGETTKTIAEALKSAGLAKFVCVGTDSSCGFEVRCLFNETNFEGTLRDILSILNNKGFKVDQRCGAHIHLDMRNRDVKVCYENMFKAQDFLRQFLSQTRLGNTYYHKQNTKDKFEDQAALKDRYHSINADSYKKYKTLEIRMHQGTLDPGELIPWIKLLTKIVNRKEVLNLPKIDTLEVATTELEIETELVKEIETRLKNKGV